LTRKFGPRRSQLVNGPIIKAKPFRPPVRVLAAIAPWLAAGTADSEIHLLALLIELLRDLRPPFGAPPHQPRPGTELFWMAVRVRMNLLDGRWQGRAELWHLGRLVKAGGDDDIARREAVAVISLDQIPARSVVAEHAFDADPIANGEMEALDVVFEIANHFRARHEAVRIASAVLRAWQAGLPVGCVERERVPAVVAPSLGWLVRLFQHDMLTSLASEIIANR